jgi:hypothetical protein
MAIIPTVHCSQINAAVDFYTNVLDFRRIDGDEQVSDPALVVLARAGDTLFLSSHAGDSKAGQDIVVMTEDVDVLFRKFTDRGLVPPKRDSPVHRAHRPDLENARILCR